MSVPKHRLLGGGYPRVLKTDKPSYNIFNTALEFKLQAYKL